MTHCAIAKLSSKATRVFSGIGQAFFHITSKVKEETNSETDDVNSVLSEFVPSREAIASAMFEFAERESFLRQDFRMKKKKSEDEEGKGTSTQQPLPATHGNNSTHRAMCDS